MNFENILTVLLSATIPSIITYLVTKKTCDSKIIQIKISKDSEINQLKLQHQHEIDKLESEHKHNIEQLEIQHQLEKDSKSDDATSVSYTHLDVYKRQYLHNTTPGNPNVTDLCN